MSGFSAMMAMDLALLAKTGEEVELYELSMEKKARERGYRAQAPERYWGEGLGTFRADTEERRNALEKAREFVHDVMGGRFRTLLLLGSVGTGKTHLACGIIRECGGIYALSPTLTERFRRARSFTASETEGRILDDCGHARLLVVDEIGRGLSEDEERHALYRIINERYNRRKPMVLVSNHKKKDFLRYIGAAATDRLAESALAVEFSGKSFRMEMRLGKEN